MAGERWDRDRLMYESDRHAVHTRDRSDECFDRPRFHDDDLVRDARYHDHHVADRDRGRCHYRPGDSSSSPRRPAAPRRQSSLDTYDRRPLRYLNDDGVDDYAPLVARRRGANDYRGDDHRDDYRDDYRPEHRDALGDDYRAPAYTPIPLPRARALAPPRRHPVYDDDTDLCYAERLRERDVVRERRLGDRGAHPHARTHRGTSPSSAASSRSSSSGDGGTAVGADRYPKKGKTKIPARLVSKRALIDLGYPFYEEGTTIIVQKALGQDNIDELLKRSDDYNKADQEVAAARSSAGNLFDERREEPHFVPPAPPAPAPAPSVVALPPAPAPPTATVVDVGPPAVEVVDRSRTVIRDVSPARTATTSSSSSWDSHGGGHHHRRHHHHQHHQQRHHDDLVVARQSRSRSRSGREIRAEIRALERELAHRPRGEVGERDVVRAERLPDGELVIYEERVERQAAGPKPPRIEKDKKGPPPKLLRAMLGTLT